MLRHADASFLQSYAWGRHKAHFGWAAARLALPPRGSAPAPVAQVLFRRIPYTPFSYGYLPRGPLLDYGDEGEIDRMERALARLARRYRAAAITWELPLVGGAEQIGARLPARGMRRAPTLQPDATRVIDLTSSMDEIVGRWHQKWRYNYRLAAKKGVAVRPAASAADFSAWYSLARQTAERDHFIIREDAYYRRFWLETAESGATTLLLAEHEGDLLAGIMVHRFGPTATYLYGASGELKRNLMPNHLLQWEAMRWARDAGAARYDLFGIAASDDPADPLAGVTEFKAGFRGQALRFSGAYDRVYLPPVYAAMRRVRRD